jgi:signal transduction histidine kinase
MRGWFRGRERATPQPDLEVVETIGRVGRLIAAELDLSSLVKAVIDAATLLSGATFGAFFYHVVDPNGVRSTLYALSGAPREAFETFPIPTNSAVFAPILRGESVVRIDDVVNDRRYGKIPPHFGMPRGHLPVASFLGVPVVGRAGEVLGALVFGHSERGMFTERHERLVVTLAAHAASAVENARRFQAAERARSAAEAAERRAALLADAGTVVASALDVETVLQRLTALAVPSMGDWCAAFLRQRDHSVRCVAFQHRDAAKTAEGLRYFTAQPFDLVGVGKVLRTGEPEIAGNLTGDETLGHGSVLTVPLVLDGVGQGALSFGRAERGAYDADDRSLAEGLASRAALAVQSAQRYQDTQAAYRTAERARWQAALLAEVSRLFAASLDVDATLDALIRLLVPTLADWAVVHLARRDGSLRLIGPAAADATLAEAAHHGVLPADRGVAGSAMAVVRDGAPLLVADVSREWLERTIGDPAALALVRRLGPRSLVIVPLVARGRTLGALTLVARTPGRRYGEAELICAEEIGRRAGLAVDTARLYRRMERAKAEAEDATRAKDEFLAVLSHELRTPINAISGSLQLVGDGAGPGTPAGRALDTVQRNVRVLRRLVADLLDVSAIVAGTLTLATTPCDLAPLIEQTIESAGPEAEASGVALKADLEPHVMVNADSVRFRQVVGNLLANAIKFTPAGGVVTVSLQRGPHRASIVVADTGPGIPRDALPGIFDRFHQAERPVSGGPSHPLGLGLGLAIVKHLVELHGGTVRAENHPSGTGATFTVELPTTA